MIRIITQKQFDAILDILRDNQKEINSLKQERDLYKKAWKNLQEFCCRFCEDKDIDFPNSEKSCEDKFI